MVLLCWIIKSTQTNTEEEVQFNQEINDFLLRCGRYSATEI